MKRLVRSVLALTAVLAIAVPAFASATTTGSEKMTLSISRARGTSGCNFKITMSRLAPTANNYRWDLTLSRNTQFTASPRGTYSVSGFLGLDEWTGRGPEYPRLVLADGVTLVLGPADITVRDRCS